MHEIYASLAGLEKFVGAEKILLAGKSKTDVNSLADVIRYLAFTRSTSRDRSRKDGEWAATLPPTVADRSAMNQAFFAPRMSTDCVNEVSNIFRTQAKNVVRISRDVQFRNPTRIIKLITTGLVVDNGRVVSVFPGFVVPSRVVTQFAKAQVSTTSCGTVTGTYNVTKAEYLDLGSRGPFIVLTVPELKLQGKAPVFDFGKLTSDYDDRTLNRFMIAGYIRDTNLVFATREQLRTSNSDTINNHEQHFINARAVAKYDDEITDDSQNRFYLSAPFGAGLTGSPIYDRFGDVIGFVENGTYIGDNLSLAVGISASGLKSSPLVQPRPATK